MHQVRGSLLTRLQKKNNSEHLKNLTTCIELPNDAYYKVASFKRSTMAIKILKLLQI